MSNRLEATGRRAKSEARGAGGGLGRGVLDGGRDGANQRRGTGAAVQRREGSCQHWPWLGLGRGDFHERRNDAGGTRGLAKGERVSQVGDAVAIADLLLRHQRRANVVGTDVGHEQVRRALVDGQLGREVGGANVVLRAWR